MTQTDKTGSLHVKYFTGGDVEIPKPAIERLVLLARLLEEQEMAGRSRLSSAELSGLTGIPAHTIRKDVSHLGQSGGISGGSGYPVAVLGRLIRGALGLDRPRTACLVGLGRLGSAILAYSGFSGSGYRLAAGFDSSLNRLEILRTTVPLYPAHRIPEVVLREGVELGIIAVPSAAAQETAERLLRGGVRGIVNFAPTVIRNLPPGVVIRNVSVTGEFDVLSALLNRGRDRE